MCLVCKTFSELNLKTENKLHKWGMCYLKWGKRYLHLNGKNEDNLINMLLIMFFSDRIF